MTAAASGTVVIDHAAGLHARPAVLLTKLAKTHAGPVRLTAGGRTIDAKSVVKVMGLKLRDGAELLFEAEGEGSDAVIAGLLELVRGGFQDPHV